MARRSRRASASKKAKQSSKKKILRIDVTHTAVVPRDPVVTFRVLTDGRGELTSMELKGLPAHVDRIEPLGHRGTGLPENELRVTLRNGMSFDYRETSRTPGKFFGSEMTNFTGRATLFVSRVVSEWSLTPRAVSGNAIGYTAVTWTIKFYPRSSTARWITRLWLSLHWRHVSAKAMLVNLQRVAQIDQPKVRGTAPTASATAVRVT
jgi:hypothetical protein